MSDKIMNSKVDVQSINTGITKNDRAKLAGQLSEVLIDTMQLLLKTQSYHWNVVGPIFKPVHDLTELHYKDLFAAVDVIAERIRALGYPAPVADGPVAKGKSKSEYNLVVSTLMPSTEEMIEQLVKDHEALVRNMRQTAETAGKASDLVTNDMLVARLTFHEKAIWMLGAIIA